MTVTGSWFMHQIDPQFAALATAVSLGGVGVLYAAWRQSHRRPTVLLLGWGLVFLSLWPWSVAAGGDRGPAIGVLVLMLGAIALIAGTGQWRAPRMRTRRAATANRAAARTRDSRGRIARGSLRALVAGPLSLAAAISLALAAFARLSWSEADRLIVMSSLVLILGAGAMAWSSADPRLARPASVLIAAALLGAALS